MSETNSPNPGLAPLGGVTPATIGLTPVGGNTPPSGTTSTTPAVPSTPVSPAAPATRPSLSELYNSPTTAAPPSAGTASRFSAPASPTQSVAQRSAPARRDEDEDAIPTGRLIGSLVSGLLVGVLCLLGWRWVWDNLHFNVSWIAVGVGFVIGFVMLSVAQKENPFVQIGAIVLGLGFSVAGVWPSLSSGNLFSILFGVFSIILGTGAAMKASSGGADDSDD